MSDTAQRIGPPDVAPDAYVHPRASVCGMVTLAAGASVWAGAVLRGDTDRLTIGAGSNIQDLTMVHADRGVPTTVGERVTVGHRAILHGCTIEDDVLIGMGAILLNRCVIGRGSIIGAGALVAEGIVIPPGSLVLGMPGRVVRSTTTEEHARIARSSEHYQRLATAHRDGVVIYHDPSADSAS
ncbi:MAG TPA: gamma carbonic anhydrase family protein [Gemmatimonadaceae bacterium]|nr:gamma carbonic anhydrase family protein [Gemmatimonadaceae bacterium]